MTEREILERAARAIGRIDRDGPRGVTLLSMAEIEAMALALVCLGLVAIPPGEPAPARLQIMRDDEWDGSGRCPHCQGWDCDPEAGCIHNH